MNRFATLLRDPLVVFLLAGAMLFGLWSLGPARRDARTVRVDDAVRSALAASHRARTGSDPDETQLRRLVSRWVDEELLLREARALGLDRGDPVLRRRLIERMTLAAAAGGEAPDEPTLEAFLRAHPERFARPVRYDLEQVFLRADAHEHRAARVDEALAAGEAAAGLGDPAISGRSLRSRSAEGLAAELGETAARAVVQAEPGAWTGPVRSPRGLHWLRVERVHPADTPPLGSIRTQVEAAWKEQARLDAEEALLRGLRERYRVVER